MNLDASQLSPELDETAPAKSADWRSRIRPILIGLVAVVSVASFYLVGTHKGELLKYLVDREGMFREFAADHPIGLPVILFVVYTLTAAVSIPLGIILSLISGWLLGMEEAVVLVSLSSTTGATLAMLISRYLLRDAVSHHFAAPLVRADEMLERDGPFYLLSLRLVHVIPFWLVNLVMGWTTISVRTFWWSSQLGMLPATLLYVYTGARLSFKEIARSGLSSILTPAALTAFFGMAVLPLVVKVVIDRLRRLKNPVSKQSSRDEIG